MSKEGWVGPAYPVEPISRALGLVTHPPELTAYPPDDISIDPLQGRTQLRLIEVAVVSDPAADARVVHLGQFGQGFVAAVMKRPAPDISADARQGLRADGGLETVREDAPVRLPPHYLSGSKLEAEKVKVDVGKVAAPVDILAVDDLRLLRMQQQLAGRQAVGNRAPECSRLLGALAMTNDVVPVPLEQDVRKVPRHPRVERVMQEEICQQGRDHPALRRPRRARHDTAVLHLHPRLQPALDIEQHPRTVRMVTDRPEHQLPVDAVEEAFEVEIEHPVAAPTTLTSCAHGIDRRFAGTIAVGIGMEHRLQDRLQRASGGFLGGVGRPPQDPPPARPTIRPPDTA